MKPRKLQEAAADGQEAVGDGQEVGQTGSWTDRKFKPTDAEMNRSKKREKMEIFLLRGSNIKEIQ